MRLVFLFFFLFFVFCFFWGGGGGGGGGLFVMNAQFRPYIGQGSAQQVQLLLIILRIKFQVIIKSMLINGFWLRPLLSLLRW